MALEISALYEATRVGTNEFGLSVFSFGEIESDDYVQTTVIEVVFGRGRLVVARKPNYWLAPVGYTPDELATFGLWSQGPSDAWCYDSLDLALDAWIRWNPHHETQPDRWRKNVNTGRYRIGGDARYEYGSFEEEIEARKRFEAETRKGDD